MNEALVAEKHHSHDRKVSTVLAVDGSHLCATDSELLAVFLKYALAQREMAA